MNAPSPLRYVADGTVYPITGGLVPTGIPAADTAALQAALDGGGMIELAAGSTWTITATLTIGSHTTLLGGPGTIVRANTNLNAPLITNADTANGNTGITVESLAFDLDRANQSGDNITVLDFTKLTDSRFVNLDVQGGKRTVWMGAGGTNGEGIVLRSCTRCLISGGRYHHNMYDGIKFRDSDHNRVENVHCDDNGRSGIQISGANGTDEDSPTLGSDYNTFTGIIITHATGVPASGAPTLSGFYIHTGRFNTISDFTIFSVEQGIGTWANSSDNCFTNGTIRALDNAIAVEEAVGKRNTFTAIRCDAYPGAGAGAHTLAGDTTNRFLGCYFTSTEAGATWTHSTDIGQRINCAGD